jgi:DNA replication protein DnaC
MYAVATRDEKMPINARFLERITTVADQRVYGTTHRKPAEMFPEEAAKNNFSYTDYLDEIHAQGVASNQKKNIALGTALARSATSSALESFDFAFQPSIDKKRIKGLADCRIIPNGENVILLEC